jgi:hypothetical protein
MEANGMTVAGQQVALTDKGLVVGDSATPLADSPLAKPLDDAGITVRYVSATKDADGKGTVAPGLQVTLRQGVQGVGTGPPSATYTFGRAHARAAAASGEITAVSPVAGGGSPPAGAATAPGGGSAAASPTGVGAGSTGTGPGPVAGLAPSALSPGAPAPGPAAAALPGLRIANASAASVYPALVGGAIVLAAAFALFRTLGVRLRWR